MYKPSIEVWARRALALALALATVFPCLARAGGFSISILGGRRTGALTNLAAPGDVTALFHNPAGLADQKGTRLHVSVSTTFMDTTFRMKALDPALFPEVHPTGLCTGEVSADCPWPVDDEGYYADEITPESYFGILPYLGLSQDLGFISPGLRDVVVSFALTAPNAYGADLPAGAPTAYNFITGYFVTASAILGAGWRVNRYLSVGASLSYNYMQLKYAQKFSDLDLIAAYDQTLLGAYQILKKNPALDLKDIRLDYTGSDHGVGWNIGLLVSPCERLHFGLSYNGATAARFEGDLEVSSTNPTIEDLRKTIAIISSTAGTFKLPTGLVVEMPIPHSVQAGVNVFVLSWLEVGFDFRLWLYNVYDKQNLDPVYDEAEAGKPMIDDDDLDKEKSYGVSYEVALGVVARPFDSLPGLELMTGVGFDKSPVPGKYFSLDNPSMNQLVWAVGVRWQALSWLRVAASYMLDWYMPRDIHNNEASPPMNIQGEALGHMPRLELEFYF